MNNWTRNSGRSDKWWTNVVKIGLGVFIVLLFSLLVLLF